MSEMRDATMRDLDRLRAVLDGIGPVAIAVSGGVDSMTLAHVAGAAQIFHAVSPAVPPHATARVRAHAARHGWDLQIVGAGEFDDPRYVANPVDRCFFCKANLYARLRAETARVICSGTNTDDLGDFRPGLRAARDQDVLHPFVEAGIDKAGIRALAAGLGLDDLAELPAQPCLASRIETGLAVRADDLALVDRLEQEIAAEIGPGDIRARVTQAGVRIEVPGGALPGALTDRLAARIAAAGHRLAGVAPYRRGSAFLRDTA